MTQATELDWGPLQEELSKQLTFTLRLLKDLNKVGEQDEEYSAKWGGKPASFQSLFKPRQDVSASET